MGSNLLNDLNVYFLIHGCDPIVDMVYSMRNVLKTVTRLLKEEESLDLTSR